jgi:plastocyanin
MPTHRRISLLSLVLIAAVALVVAGCGSGKKSTSNASAPAQGTTGSDTTSSGSAQVVKLMADPGGALKFTTTTLHAKAGVVTIELTNPASVPHSVAVEGNGVDKDAPSPAGQGASTQVTVTLKQGTYTFYCPVPGHKAAGMKGTLIVS